MPKISNACLPYHPFQNFVRKVIKPKYDELKVNDPNVRFSDVMKEYSVGYDDFVRGEYENSNDPVAKAIAARHNSAVSKEQRAARLKRKGNSKQVKALYNTKYGSGSGFDEEEGEGYGGVLMYDNMLGGATSQQIAQYKGYQQTIRNSMMQNNCARSASMRARKAGKTGYSIFSAMAFAKAKNDNGGKITFADSKAILPKIAEKWDVMAPGDKIKYMRAAKLINRIGLSKGSVVGMIIGSNFGIDNLIQNLERL